MKFQLYNQIRLIYEAEFRGVAYDTINNYGYGTNHPLKFIRLSYRLLQTASSLPDALIKLWGLLPQATHSMIHVPLSGIPTLYTLFQRAHQNGRPAPKFMIPNGNFFRLTDFDRFYFGHENKMYLWNTVFNIGKLDTRILANPATSHLAYSMKTDGHMISILYEKTSVEFVPQAKNDLIRQKKNIDFTNRTKGSYPLYKEPTDITANDRIIGIDPGVRDIIYAIDCDADELVDKRSTKQYSFAYSNTSYKLRSGMNWIKQKELASRLSSDIQASYDQLKTRNTYTNQGVMDLLHSIALTHNKSVLIEYVRSNFNIRSRPAALSRGQQDQGN
ncbi:hypothetical protein CU097_002052 [Rhizopus azygosporus]|uniref:Transposase n=1 Tax=Rhizopus azygosporus TaxID=86630 RepID=A0A367IWA9_RHIAZ|nr:hypothetical protein CU097_002052 [Rhizopus azygosporus]